MEILIAFLVLGIIILIHELGHFLAAKFFKMPVREFAIGMGPYIYSYEGESTTYSFRAIPMGGFVNIDGMEVDSKVENGFNTKSPIQRFVVLFAGVFMNFLLAFIIIFSMLMINGKAIQNNESKIGNIYETAKSSGILKVGDKIIKIEETSIQNWQEIGKAVTNFNTMKNSQDKERQLKIEILREGEKLELEVPLTFNSEGKRYFLGILPEYDTKRYLLGEAFVDSFKTFGGVFNQTLTGFKMLVTGQVKKEEISGPLGIIKVVGEASRGGVGIVLWLIVMLSINVGIFNLLPFPALDGGRIIFVLLELIGINVNKKLEEKIHTGGMILLILLIVYITGNDIFNMRK
ncbi:MAG: M50 family metallopeptidase [Fusobacteriaceae bacterium]